MIHCVEKINNSNQIINNQPYIKIQGNTNDFNRMQTKRKLLHNNQPYILNRFSRSNIT